MKWFIFAIIALLRPFCPLQQVSHPQGENALNALGEGDNSVWGKHMIMKAINVWSIELRKGYPQSPLFSSLMLL